MIKVKNKKVTILGAAKSGMATAELVLKLKGFPKISEAGPAEKLDHQWLKRKRIPAEWGGHTRAFIEDSDLLVLSPGVRIDAEPVKWAQNKKIPVIGEIELAAAFCSAPIIAVTGSNGKTTVVTLIAEILKKAGKSVCLCGNIGTPFSKYVLNLKKKDFVVLEVSSFQMESIVDFRPHVAVLLNFSQNHLDRHKDLQEYFEAKKRIFMNQKKTDYAVLNYQIPMIRDLKGKLKAEVVYFNSPEIMEKTTVRNPNHLAAMAVGKVLGVSEETAKKVFARFKGVEHRLEWVRSIRGVDFFNDSKATTAEAGRWALENFTRPVIMICGGRDKNIDFSVLRDLARRKVKKMLVIGEAREKIRKSFSDVVPLEECDSLESAVRRGRDLANEGDCVVLTPMCTSFDMFANFEERGKTFKELVKKL